MALLAEQKKKAKYGIDPRNLNWSNDDSKFGQKLMEKMGWSKGKGLGANEDGNVDHVKASYKSDSRGLGCSNKDADAWIAHQDDFNELLKNLNSENGTETSQATTTAPVEDGRKRYYGRFSRGQVSTLRSTEDLNCIFGKRKRTRSTSKAEEEAQADSTKADMSEEHKHGLTTTTSSSSIQEYFARKMAERKAKELGETGLAGQQGADSGTDTEVADLKKNSSVSDKKVLPVFGAVAFSYDDNKDDCLSSADTSCPQSETAQVLEVSGHETQGKQKKKKKKKSDKTFEEAEDEVVGEEVKTEEADELVKKAKGKKRKKDKEEEDVAVSSSKIENGSEDVTEPQKKNKKRDKKDKQRVEPSEDDVNEKVQSKTNKKKKSGVNNETEIEDSVEPIKKKKKKNKNTEGNSDNDAADSPIEPSVKSKKNSKSNKKDKQRNKDKTVEITTDSVVTYIHTYIHVVENSQHNKKNVKRKRKRSVSISEITISDSNISEICSKNDSAERKKKKKKSKKRDVNDGSESPLETVSCPAPSDSETLEGRGDSGENNNSNNTVSSTKSEKTKKKKAGKEEKHVSGFKEEMDVVQALDSNQDKPTETKDASKAVNSQRKELPKKKKKKKKKKSVSIMEIAVQKAFPGSNISEICGYGNQSQIIKKVKKSET